MKRLLLFAVLCTSPVLFGQEGHAAGEAKEEKAEGPIWGLPRLTWTTLNFALLALGLGYLIGKSAPAFFRGRTEEIQAAIREASKAKQEADARAAEIERKLAALGAEIDRLRGDSRTEMEAEALRTREETGHAIEKVQQHAEQEIASAGKHALQELKAYSARLALELAEQRVKAQMTPRTEDNLVSGFVEDLARHRTQRETH